MPSNKSNRMYKVDEELKKEISNIISLQLVITFKEIE